MATITIEFEDTDEGIARARTTFERLAGDRAAREVVAERIDHVVGDENTGIFLSPEQAQVQLSRLTPGALASLEFIAQNAPEVGFDEVAQHLGVTPQVLGGNMSSFGHSAPDFGNMIQRNYDRRIYMMDAEAARYIIEQVRIFRERRAR